MRVKTPDYPGTHEISQDLVDGIFDQLNRGLTIVNYGHGSTLSFARGDIFPPEDIPDLSNDQRLPAMVMMTLPHSNFAMPDGSRFLTDETHLSDGAVAAFASMVSFGSSRAQARATLGK
jgi:hypothetical protein